MEQKSLFCGKIPTLLPTVVTVGRSPKAAALITPTCAEDIPSISLSSHLYFHIFGCGFPSFHTTLSFTTWSDFFFFPKRRYLAVGLSLVVRVSGKYLPIKNNTILTILLIQHLEVFAN